MNTGTSCALAPRAIRRVDRSLRTSADHGKDAAPEVARRGEGAMYCVNWTTEEGASKATAWLMRPDGVWNFAALRGPKNAEVPERLTARVAAWVKRLARLPSSAPPQSEAEEALRQPSVS